MKLNPIHDRIFVRPDTPETEVNGIAMPIEFMPQNYRGTVVATGPGVITRAGVLVPPSVQPGDRVLYARPPQGFDYDRATVQDDSLLVMRDGDLLAVLEP